MHLKPIAPKIETPRNVVRMATTCDVESIIKYYRSNAGHLGRFEPLQDESFYTTGFWEQSVSKFDAVFSTDRALKLFIFANEAPSTVIGAIEYSNFSRGPFQACKVGYSIGAAYEGRGLMSESLRASNKYVFEQLGFHRIMANYLPHNERSGHLLKRLGFQVEGYARDYLKIQDEWRDHILTSLIHDPSAP